MRALEQIIAMNAQAAGREAGHADTDGDDRLAERIHAAAVEHGPSQFCGDERGCPFTRAEHIDLELPHAFVPVESDPQVDGPDRNDESYMWFATGFLRGRSEG